MVGGDNRCSSLSTGPKLRNQSLERRRTHKLQWMMGITLDPGHSSDTECRRKERSPPLRLTSAHVSIRRPGPPPESASLRSRSSPPSLRSSLWKHTVKQWMSFISDLHRCGNTQSKYGCHLLLQRNCNIDICKSIIACF